MTPGSTITDPDRLAAVHESGLLDTAPEVQFDELTQAAAALLGAPFAFMTAVDDRRSYWKSTVGVDDGTRENAVGDSFCQYVIMRDDDLLVGDAAAEPLTRANPSIESMGVRAWAGCPVHFRGQVLGSFCVVDVEPRVWSDEDRRILQRLTNIAEREIELRAQLDRARTESERNARLLAEHRELLSTLRASMLPPSTPTVPGVTVATWHRAAADGHALLGDFFDLFPLPDRRWGFAIGDVCGHGAAAARLTSLVRYSLRAAAVHESDPATALRIVDTAIKADQTESNRFATVFFATLDDATPKRLRYARGGHPVPLIRRADGTTVPMQGGDGPLVGIVSEPTFRSDSVELGDGDIVVMFTDGLPECRRPGGPQIGIDAIQKAVEGVPVGAGAHQVLDVLVGMLDAHAETLGDDAAIVVVEMRADG